ncbi:diguanylate cyclase [Pontibacterium granulatum]|uniref:diguanylate cyclase n=1 Tax=Pontibacterium granulatum TaxID=2036029 RepID=UPI00249B1BEB|nr:diguanylate cyclase [Pontibacterium granulatum]MDI3324844.1 diguanylate cyclase [Pontibacterium granulatum]
MLRSSSNPFPSSALTWRDGIGTRLGGAICVVFIACLLAVCASIYGLYHQYLGFRQLSGQYFERAMTAAELTRDAELIAAEVFESMVGADRSDRARGSNSENLIRVYQSVRASLDNAVDAPEVEHLAQIDRWQQPYFESLKRLDGRLGDEYRLKSDELLRIDRLFVQLQALEQQVDAVLANGNPDDIRYINHALAALGYCTTAMRAERVGQLRQLRQSALAQLDLLSELTLNSKVLVEFHESLEALVREVFEERQPALIAERATLATARETRVLAQKLTSSTFNYYLQLKQSAKEAVEAHQAMVVNTMIGLVVFALFMVALTLFMLLYIRRIIIQRLHQLYLAVNAHMEGNTASIPHEGRDEISLLGHAFEQFASARYTAESALRDAREETESANRKLQQANEQLRELSEIDELTGIANRRTLDRHLEQEYRRLQRHNGELSLMMIDIDWFKEYNDQYGHPAGDRCLRQVAQCLSQQVRREGELVARYGGEEFCIVLPGAGEVDAEACARRLQEAVSDLGLEHPRGKVTLSIGIATVHPECGLSEARLFEEADRALYQAKTEGRNCVVNGANLEPNLQ